MQFSVVQNHLSLKKMVQVDNKLILCCSTEILDGLFADLVLGP